MIFESGKYYKHQEFQDSAILIKKVTIDDEGYNLEVDWVGQQNHNILFGHDDIKIRKEDIDYWQQL